MSFIDEAEKGAFLLKDFCDNGGECDTINSKLRVQKL